MQFRKILILVFIFSSFISIAQKSHNIKFEISNYTNDTLLLAYFYGEQQLIKDTLYAINPGEFVYKGDSLIESGVYIALVYPSKEYFQFLVNGKDQEFILKTDLDNLQKLSAEGSKDNKLFFNYLEYISGKNVEAQTLAKEKALLNEENKDLTEINLKLGKLDDDVNNYQLELIIKNPNSLSAFLIKANRDIKIPDFEGTDDELKVKRYYYYKNHYFDNIELKNPAVLLTPFIHEKVMSYIDKLTVPQADSINKSIDTLLSKMSLQSEIWRYYVSQFLNKYGRSNIIGMDAVYVHMAKEYYGKGLTPWVEEKTLIRILDNAVRMEDVLIGKIAPNVRLFKQDSTLIKIHDIEADYLVLLFWKPDCGHCKTSMPDLIKFANDYKEKGVKVAAICTKLGKKVNKCWEGVDELKMKDLAYNLADEKNVSGMHGKYNIRVTPSVFVLDKDKKIIIKQIPSEKLGEVIDNIIKEKEKQK